MSSTVLTFIKFLDVNFSSFEDGIDLWHDASEKDQFMFRRLHQRFRRRNTGPVADDTSRSGKSIRMKLE